METSSTGDIPAKRTTSGGGTESSIDTQTYSDDPRAKIPFKDRLQNLSTWISIIVGILTILGIVISYSWHISSKLSDVNTNTSRIIDKVGELNEKIIDRTSSLENKINTNKTTLDFINNDLKDLKYQTQQINEKLKIKEE